MNTIVQITDVVKRLFRIKTFYLLRKFTAVIPIIFPLFALSINPAFTQVFIDNIEPLIETSYHYPIHQYQT
jgi:hypothetical protein